MSLRQEIKRVDMIVYAIIVILLAFGIVVGLA